MRTRLLQRWLTTRERIQRHQARGTVRLLRHAAANIPFYRGVRRFEDLPVLDKAEQQANFATLNTTGITLAEASAAIAAGHDTVRDCFVGQSTGTSGNRGRYVISPAERFTWLGTIVAKALSDAPYRRRRVALALPGFSALYRSADEGSPIRLAFFDLARGVESWIDEFARFAAQVVVAPPKVLRRLAAAGVLSGVEAFSGAEVLDPLDRAVIERATGRPLREIYMATEGLLGVSCRHGMLHLAEDVMRFEWEAVPGSALRVPIITDLVRRVQPMIRYRMNDLLELSDARCPCGSALQAVARVHGRMDDVFVFAGPGGSILVTPDVLRNAVVDAHPSIQDFRVIQRADGRVTVAVDAALPEAVHDAARVALATALARIGVAAPVESLRGIAPRDDRKLRRVERERG